MNRRSSATAIVLLLIFWFGYPALYLALRATHVLVHTAYWTSAEGLDGHFSHDMVGPGVVRSVFHPLIVLELWVLYRAK